LKKAEKKCVESCGEGEGRYEGGGVKTKNNSKDLRHTQYRASYAIDVD